MKADSTSGDSRPRLASAEHRRLQEANAQAVAWRQWGPYLAARQWGTVREDYSADGDAWDYVSHDMARSRAYRWGEDGIGGLSDDQGRLCLALALWNGRDPIVKERLFGLTNREGNHGEDVKELYYYLDATPTHSYLKMLYKYPQRAFPYDHIVAENGRRDKTQGEYELLDTGIFDDDRYFDVFIEYAKAAPNDILMQITIENRGPEQATLHVLPQLWFRNSWAWRPTRRERPSIASAGANDPEHRTLAARHPKLGHFELYAEHPADLLFTENETNVRRFGTDKKAAGYFKDAFNDFLVHGDAAAINPGRTGTKAAAHYVLSIGAGGSAVVRLRLRGCEGVEGEASPSPHVETPAPDQPPPRSDSALTKPFADFDDVMAARRREADEFYAVLQADLADPDARAVQRQALAGMIWNKQFYCYDVREWLAGDPLQPAPPPGRSLGRNHDWGHFNSLDILSMPDNWEYPWFAAWDLAFHCLPLALVDAEFAKAQLVLLTREWFMHPNGQLPAYEWAFGDVNPPVHAWAAWRVFQIDRKQRGDAGDLAFLERVFHKLMLNFTWWVNRKDTQGRNIFQGGFLGLDNIGIFDRSAPLPHGGFINQADGTSWMAMYSLNLMRIALELALHNPVYEDIASKFFEHFLNIAQAMNSMGAEGHSLWDENDQFYYDTLELESGRAIRLKVRSMVGLIPLFAVETLEPQMLDRLPDFTARLTWFLKHRPDLANLVSRWEESGRGERRLLSLLRGHRMKKLLLRMLDETEFLSEYGVRSLSKRHLKEPFAMTCDGHPMSVAYEPGESHSAMFGGNSNWRGPIWFPVNYLIVESLQKFHHYYGDDFKIECPTGSGRMITIKEAAEELTRRLTRLFLRDNSGNRPVNGDRTKLQTDPHFRDLIQFHEYFHGDSGRGLGASHQTGWTGLVAKLLQPRGVKAQASEACATAATED